ncbi:hypothetical protein I3760_01G079200 [Carya illinoinensis]|nr:hypothetical protein I3760_01G079200 [Carya illinoinensis]
MNNICWNCRGLGNPQTVQDLSLLVKDKWPTLVFVCETKTKSYKISNLQRRLGMEGCLVVDSDGRRGGLVLLWRYENVVEVINYSSWHISVMVKGEKKGRDWQFTGFYGHPETRKRELSWELLR